MPFTLTIAPRFIEGQGVLAGDPDVELVVIPPGGAPEVHALGEAGEGDSLSLPGLAAPASGTTFGLLAEAGGETRGYGQAVFQGEIAPGAALSLDILVPEHGAVGEWGTLPDDKKRFAPAVAMLPGGAVFMFGGHDPDTVTTDDATDEILVMRDTDAGKNAFRAVAEKIPKVELYNFNDRLEETSARSALTATVVTVDDEPRIFVAGGRPRWWEAGGSAAQWFVFDPATESIDRKGELTLPRSDHLAIPFRNGRVLLFGGITGNRFPMLPSYEIFNPNILRVEAGNEVSDIDAEHLHAMGAPYRDDVVVCGGLTSRVVSGIWYWEPSAGCNRYQSTGEVESFEPLPAPVAAAAMAPLPDGGLLVTGGVSEEFVDDRSTVPPVFGSGPAHGDIYRYDGSWQLLDARLQYPRAHHEMIPLADGRVLIVGGTTEATALYGDVPEAVRCPELFDPVTNSVSPVDCTDAGQGAKPPVSWYPGEGAFVLEGFRVQGFPYEGSTTYGLVSTGPPFEP